MFNKEKAYQNYLFFSSRLSKDLPLGVMFPYGDFNFYIKDYSTSQAGKEEFLENEKDKLFIICEYYNPEIKEFQEKIFHEDLVRNRLMIAKKIAGE